MNEIGEKSPHPKKTDRCKTLAAESVLEVQHRSEETDERQQRHYSNYWNSFLYVDHLSNALETDNVLAEPGKEVLAGSQGLRKNGKFRVIDRSPFETRETLCFELYAPGSWAPGAGRRLINQ